MFKHIILSLLITALLAAATPVQGQDANPMGNDAAKQLFQKMEDSLAKAKTLECNLGIKFVGPGEPGFPVRQMEIAGRLTLGEGNRVRLDMKKTSPAEPTDLPGVPFWLNISDGSRELHQDSGMPKPQIIDHVEENLRADVLTLLARSGFFLSTAPLPPVEATDMKDRFPVSEFRLGPAEKIGDSMAQRLDYRFDVKGQKGPNGEDAPFRASVWLDPKTTLPMKRTITWKFAGVEVMSITESYDNLVVDKTIDPKRFQLPEKQPGK
jgi:outer membrane lipoprotein-sorting protein